MLHLVLLTHMLPFYVSSYCSFFQMMTSFPTPFRIIHLSTLGLARWEQAREQWLAHKSDDTDSTAKAAVPLEVDEIIDVIFSPRWRNAAAETGPPRAFSTPVPLPQMVDVLVDLWEAEGLDT
jgi:hypothetical protein